MCSATHTAGGEQPCRHNMHARQSSHPKPCQTLPKTMIRTTTPSSYAASREVLSYLGICELIVSNLPYFRVLSARWDQEFANKMDFLAQIDANFALLKVCLAPNGFAKILYDRETLAQKHFDVLNTLADAKQLGPESHWY